MRERSRTMTPKESKIRELEATIKNHENVLLSLELEFKRHGNPWILVRGARDQINKLKRERDITESKRRQHNDPP